MKKQKTSDAEDSMDALCKDLLDALKEAMDSQTFMKDYEAWKSKNDKA